MGTHGMLTVFFRGETKHIYNHCDGDQMFSMLQEFFNSITEEQFQTFIENYQKIKWDTGKNDIAYTASSTLKNILNGTCREIIDDKYFECDYMSKLNLDERTLDWWKIELFEDCEKDRLH